jgi:hypothetical protein
MAVVIGVIADIRLSRHPPVSASEDNRASQSHVESVQNDAVDGAHSAASKCHRVVALKRTTNEGSRPWARLARLVSCSQFLVYRRARTYLHRLPNSALMGGSTARNSRRRCAYQQIFACSKLQLPAGDALLGDPPLQANKTPGD